MIFTLLKFLLLLPIIIFLASIDVAKKKKDGVHMYGIYGYFGLPGRGKTMAMSHELNRLREKYGDKIYIMTNYFYDKQDFEFTSWKDLLKSYDKPLVVAWDEVQNEFNSRDFKNFPISLMTKLTQVRKGHGIRIYYTSQRWHFVDKNFRSLSFGVSDCMTIGGRFTIVKQYDPMDYEELNNTHEVGKKMKIHPKRVTSFIQTSKERDCYDSYQMLESAKSKEYMDRTEISNIENKLF